MKILFWVPCDPINPFLSLPSTEDEIYYLHFGEIGGTCMAKIGREDAAWLLKAEPGETIVDITCREGILDSVDRLTLEMISFSQCM